MINPKRVYMPGTEQHSAHAESKFRSMLALEQRKGKWGKNASHFEVMEDGTQILIQISIPTTYEIIMTGGSVDLLHGMTNPSEILPTDFVVGGATVSKPALHDFFPGSAQDMIDHKGRAARPEQKLAISPQAYNDKLAASPRTFAQTASVAPAMFTGKMRQAAQLAMGRKLNSIEYQHSFQKTHGIFMDGDTPWLVEISLENGVIAMRLPADKKSSSKQVDALIKAQFPVIPTGKAFPSDLPKAIEKGTVRVLLEPITLAQFYVYLPYFTDCSWAFNDLGNTAVNTCWDWPGEWKIGYMYQISIAGGGGAGPTHATLSKQSQGYLYSPVSYHGVSNSGFQVPSGNGQDLETFGMTNFGPVRHTPPGGDYVTPIYAFFVDNALQVYNHISRIAVIPYRPAGWLPFDPGTAPAYRYDASIYSGKLPSRLSDYDVDFRFENGNDQIDIFSFSGPGINTPVASKPDSSYIACRFTHKSTGALTIIPTLRTVYDRSESGYYSEERGEAASESRSISLAISAWSRTSVFVNDHYTSSTGSKSSIYGSMGLFLPDGAHGDIYGHGDRWVVIDTTTYLAPEGSIGGVIGNYGSFQDFQPQISGTYAFAELNLSNADGSTQFVGNGPPTIDATTSSAATPSTGQNFINFSCQNHLHSYSSGQINNPSPEYSACIPIMLPSPDDFGSYVTLTSGDSAFKGSNFCYKFPNGFGGFHVSPQDGEDMSGLTPYTSFVGYS